MHCRKDNNKKCKKTQKLCQKPSPKGEPRTLFSHPTAAKNDVLPACQLLFRHFINFMFFSHFLWAPWNSCFTYMGAHFQTNVLPFVRFPRYFKCIWAGLWARWAPRPCPHSPKTILKHDFCSFASLLVWFVIDSWCIFPKTARRCWCWFLCFREWTFNETCKLNKQWTPFQKGTVAGLRAALLDNHIIYTSANPDSMWPCIALYTAGAATNLPEPSSTVCELVGSTI